LEKSLGPDRQAQQRPRIAICGIRGIPANYGGFETFTEELAPRLVALGFSVVVYGRRHVIPDAPAEFHGVLLRLLPAPRHKYFETPLHTLLCFLDLLFHRVDLIFVCNAANSPFIWLPRLFGMPVVVNVDGVERLRKKWNWLGKIWYRLGERCSVLFASRIVTDAEVIRDYYRRAYNADSSVIAYGYNSAESGRAAAKAAATQADTPWCEGWSGEEEAVFATVGVRPGSYLLYVSRLEPENNAHIVLGAYLKLPSELRVRFPLLIVGDAPYARDYIASLKRQADNTVIFSGYRFGHAYVTLQLGAYAYIQATEVGGTHPALVEAMGFSNCVIANGTPENLEVLGDAGLFYRVNEVDDLTQCFGRILSDPGLVSRFRRSAADRAKQKYRWEEIAERYAQLFREHLPDRT
jgi:glycosyltransferase involved in cell wall biosynthesis